MPQEMLCRAGHAVLQVYADSIPLTSGRAMGTADPRVSRMRPLFQAPACNPARLGQPRTAVTTPADATPIDWDDGPAQ